MKSAAFRDQYGPWALVAGASEGLGAAMATALAKRGLSLVLVSRRAEPLRALADELVAKHGVQVRPVALDLAAADLAVQVRAAVTGVEVGLLVYNAAASYIGQFLDGELAEHLRAIDVNCRGPLVLAHELGRPMVARGRGGIILMSSLVASQGGPLLATYTASKAFNLIFAEGLWDELRSRGVDVLACRPGATRTPGFERSKPNGSVPMQDAAVVAETALAALGRAPSVVTGGFNRVAAFIMELIPRRWAVRTMGRSTRRLYAAR